MYLGPYVHFPTVIVPILIFCIVFVTLYCCFKQVTSLHNDPKVKLQQQPEDTEGTPMDRYTSSGHREDAML